MGLAGAVHRRAPLLGGEGQAGDPRGRRGRLARHQRRYWKEFSGRDIPVDDGPLSAKIVVDGKEIGGFDLSAGVLHDPRGRGRVAEDHARSSRPIRPRATRSSPRRRASRAGRRQGHEGRLLRAASSRTTSSTWCPTRRCGACRSTARSWPRSSRSVLTTTPCCRPGPPVAQGRGRRRAIPPPPSSSSRRRAPPGRRRSPSPTGTRHRPTWSTSTPRSPERRIRIGRLGSQWQWLRPDDGRWRLSDGSLVITSQNGDLQGKCEHGQERRAAGRQRRLDGGVEARLLEAARRQQRAGRRRRLRRRQQLREAGLGDGAARLHPINKLRVVLLREQNGAATTLQVTGADAQRIVGADGAIWLRLAKARQHLQGVLLEQRQRVPVHGRDDAEREPAQAGLVAFNRGRDLDRPRRRVRLLPDREPGRPGAAGRVMRIDRSQSSSGASAVMASTSSGVSEM